MSAFELATPAFDDGDSVPTEYTCDGADVSPQFRVSGVPDDAETLALVVDDPDAPGGTFVHWLLWNVPAETERIPRDVPRTKRVSELGGASQGTNGFEEVGYRGPCPPEDHGAHTYRFTLFALDTTLDVKPGAGRATLDAAMEGHVVAETRLTGTYDR